MQPARGISLVGAVWMFLLAPAFAAEQAEDAERRTVLAGCADEIVYGDPGFDNVLEFSYEGKRLRLHFEAMEVEQDRGRYAVRAPRIIKGNPEQYGWTNAAPASASLSMGAGGGTLQGSPVGLHVVIEPGKTFASDQVTLRSLVLPSLDCLQEMPGFPSMSDLFSGRRSDFTYTWGKQGEEPWLILESHLKEGDATLRLAVSSPPQRRPATAAADAAVYLTQGAIEADGLVYGALEVIHIEPLTTPNQGQGAVPRPFTLPLPAAGKRLARTTGDSAEVYDYQVLEAELIVVDQHRLTPEPGERDEGRIFEIPVDPLGAPLNDLTLDESTLVHRFVVSRVTQSALPPLRLESDSTVERPRRPAMLAMHELPAMLPPVRLARLEPHAFTLTDGGKRVGLAMRSTILEERVLLEHVEQANAPPVALPPGAEEQVSQQLGAGGFQALQTLFAEEMDWPPYWDNDAERDAFLAWITPLFIEMDLPTDDLQTIQEAEDVSVLMDEHLGESLLNLAYLIFQNRQFADQAVSGDEGMAMSSPTVVIDPGTGHPVLRRERLVAPMDDLTLDIDIVYGGTMTRLQAKNSAQGADTLDLPLPAGLFDARQVLSLVPFLQLTEGEPQTLYMLDLAAHQSMRSSHTETLYTAHLRPHVSRLSLALAGKETLQLADGEIAVLRIRAALVGLLPPPLGQLLFERPALDSEGAQLFELLARAEAPHQLLRIFVGDQEILGDSHSAFATTEHRGSE